MKPRSLIAATVVLFASCGGTTPSADGPRTVTLLAYDSFTPPEGIFDSFTERTGISVEVVTGGDSGSVISKAILTSGNPEGDVLWGVDDTTLSR
ncbi:MAG: thiamine ABC transporter substrate-binding protein, partial [Actinobacteria bacterium]|nr:thiamine ABC transporter substrate-binding protein [Actinomycetota bacterium]